MNVKIIKGAEITRPTTTPLKSSLLDHVAAAGNLQQVASFGLRNNEGLWVSYNCLDTIVPTPICPEPMSTGKSFGFAEWVPGFEFALYGGVQCRTVGLDKQDMAEEIVRVFDLNESKGIEQVLLFNRFVPAESGEDVPWPDPVDLTPGSSITLAAALAILEGYAASVYAGVPTIHMSRAAASILNERITWVGDLAYTRLGSKVVMGGGYDSPGEPDGNWDLYATGEVYVERSEKAEVTDVHVLPGDGSGTGSDENGLMDNTVIGLVERMFRVGVDCFVAKATGTVSGPSGGVGGQGGFGV